MNYEYVAKIKSIIRGWAIKTKESESLFSLSLRSCERWTFSDE